jgi:hypothetical protein
MEGNATPRLSRLARIGGEDRNSRAIVTQRPASALASTKELLRQDVFVSASGTQNGGIGAARTDDLEPDRQAFCRLAAGHRAGGLLAQIDGEGERGPYDPAA